MNADSKPAIATIIVNYKTAGLVIDNLHHMVAEQAAYEGSVIYIVDNASPGDDAERIAAHISEQGLEGQVRLIAHDENGGFAKGNNVALREIMKPGAGFDYIFLLNPDAYPRAGALQALTQFMARKPRAGLAGARLENPDGTGQRSAFRYFTALGELVNSSHLGLLFNLFPGQVVAPEQRDETYETDWVCGAAVLIRRDVFETIGLFDETYFLYYEETDLMLRARRAGWETWYVHEARAVHLVGQSSGVVDGKLQDEISPPYWFRSRKHYFRANHGRAYGFLADLAWLSGTLLYAGKRLFTGKSTAAVLANIKRFLVTGADKPAG